MKARKVKRPRSRRPARRQRRRSCACAWRSCARSCRAPPTRTRSSRCTTCGSPPSGCATSWRSPAPSSAPTPRRRRSTSRAAGPAGRDPRLRRAGARDVARSPSGCAPATPAALVRRAGDHADLDPALLQADPARADHAGLAALLRRTCGRAAVLFDALPRAVGDSSARASAPGSSTRSASAPASTRRGVSIGARDRSRAEPEAPRRRARPRRPALYFNRELSWLDFNDRVLQLAEDERSRCSSA